jgi:protein gp37
MSQHSDSEWADATWNPVRGCRKVSPGCEHCYAARHAERWRGLLGHPYEQGFELRLVPEKLVEPLRWTRSRTVYVNSMSDLFQGGVPESFIAKVLGVMRLADWHVYQLLTKRPERMQRVLSKRHRDLEQLAHVRLGVSVEDRRSGLPRIDALRRTPAAVRFLCIEPLLEDLGELDLQGIDWVVVGGESGPGARPMEKAWVRAIRRQCREQRIPFFFKQWGGVQTSLAGRVLDGRQHDGRPSFSPVAVPPRRERLRRLELARAGTWMLQGS